MCASIRLQLAPRASAARRGRGSGRRRAAGRGRRGRRRPRRSTRVADAALGRVAAAVDRRRRDTGSRCASGGGSLGQRSARAVRCADGRLSARSARYPPLASGKHRCVNRRLPRDRAAFSCTSPRCPGGRLGPEAYRFVDWLAAAGQSWWQVLPLGPPDRHRSPYKARSAFAAWPGLLAARRGAGQRRGGRSTFRERHAFWIEDWERLRRAAARSRTRCGSSASGARCARYCGERGRAAVRRRRDLRRARRASTTSPIPSCSRTGCVAGAPPDAFSRDRAAVGQPAVRLAGAAPARLPLVGRAAAAHAGAVRPRADRPLPRVRRLLGGARRGPRPRVARQLEARARAAPCSTRSPRGARRDLPLVAEDLGVITPRGRAPARRARPAGDGRAPVRLRARRSRDSPHRLENHVENRVVYTGTHDHDTARGWYESLDPGVRARWSTPSSRARDVAERRAVVGPDPARAALAGAGRDGPGAGRARARQRGADERPGARRAATGAGSWSPGR